MATTQHVTSSSTTNPDSWATILGNICATCAPSTTTGTHAVSYCPSPSVHQQSTPSQKAKKKKRCSILEQIYGGSSNKSTDFSHGEKNSVPQVNSFLNNLAPVSSFLVAPQSSRSFLASPQPSRSLLGSPQTSGGMRVIASESNVLGSPAILRRNVRVANNPSTNVTYSKNVCNVLYGDTKHAAPCSPSLSSPRVASGDLPKPSPFPLITFSNEKDRKLKRELFAGSAEKEDEGADEGNAGSIPTSDLLAMFVDDVTPARPSVRMKGRKSVGGLLEASPLPGVAPIAPLTSLDIDAASTSRSENLDKYVNTLLESPPNNHSNQQTSGIACDSVGAASIQQQQQQQQQLLALTSPQVAVGAPHSDDSSDGDCTGDNSDEDVCIDISSFKRGLYEHLAQASSQTTNSPHQSTQQQSAVYSSPVHDILSTTPTHHLLNHRTLSAFRAVPPKNEEATLQHTATHDATRSSEEMTILLRKVLPTSLQEPDVVADHEVVTSLQNNVVVDVAPPSCVDERCVNPISCALTVGDDSHFVPIGSHDLSLL